MARYRWISKNPARTPDVPIGYFARSEDGAVRGAIICVSARYAIDSRIQTLQIARSLAADSSCQAVGSKLFFSYRSLAKRYVLYVINANEESSKLWKVCNAESVKHSDYELLFPIRWSQLLEEKLQTLVGRRMSQLVSKSAALADVVRNRTRQSNCDEYLSEVTDVSAATVPAACGPQLLRDEAFLRWRYSDVPDGNLKILQYKSQQHGADGFLAVSLSRRGYRGQIRALTIADLWGDIPPDSIRMLLSSLAGMYSTEADVIVVRSLMPMYMEAARSCGLIRRNFGQPISWYIDHQGIVSRTDFALPVAAA